MASGASSRTYSLAGDRDANKSLKAVQAFCELDPASVDSWTLKIRAHLSDAGCLDVIDKRVDLTVRQWLLETGRVLRDADDENMPAAASRLSRAGSTAWRSTRLPPRPLLPHLLLRNSSTFAASCASSRLGS